MNDDFKAIENELIGVWKYGTEYEGEGNRQWCASINVAGRLIDTDKHPTIEAAIKEARRLVDKYKKR